MEGIFDYLSVESSVVDKMKKQVKNNGYSYCFSSKQSNHSADSFLYFVIVQGGYKNGYALLNYNAATDSLYSGTYDLTYPEVIRLYSTYLRDVTVS